MTIRRHSRRATLVLALLTVALPTVAHAGSTPPTPPPIGTTSVDGQPGGEVVQSWALSPAAPANPDEGGNRPELSYESAPGEVIDDAVTLFNFGTEQMTFHVYATDAFNNDVGNFDLLPRGEQPTDVGSWVKVAQDLVTVPAGKQVTIPIIITVPAQATAGDHVGAVLASSETPGTGPNGEAVVLDRRTGTRLYLRVKGDILPAVAVTGVDASYHHSLNAFGGSATVSFRLENRGNVRLTGKGTVSVSGPFGIGDTTVSIPEVPELLPGEHVDLSVDVKGVPALFLDSTTVRFTAEGLAGDVAAVSAEGTTSTFAPPVALLLMLLLLILALLLLRRVRAHGVDVRDAATDDHADELAREMQPT